MQHSWYNSTLFYQQDKVFAIYFKNGLGNKSETDFHIRRNKDKKREKKHKKSEYLHSGSEKKLDFPRQIP